MPLFERLANSLGLDEFDKRHKTAFVFFACAVIFVIIFWVMQMRDNIINPLYGGVDPRATNGAVVQNSADAVLRAQDTDGDGLSDYDEINLYQTSPYLGDSDSDGNDDRTEVQSGHDPNCPAGQSCAVDSTDSPSQTVPNELDDLLNGGVTSTATPSTSGSTAGSSSLTEEEKGALRQILGSSNDPQVLRNFLLQGGADKAYVDSLSDADLTRILNDLLTE